MIQLPLHFGLMATGYVRRLRGGSQAQLLRASDGKAYVTKFVNNPQHPRVLANELLACRLGTWLGLSVPRVEIIDVPQQLIERYPEMVMETTYRSYPCASGLQLGVCYVGGDREKVLDTLPESMFENVVNVPEFAQMLVLDKWTGNADGRQAVFTRCVTDCHKYQATFIDQGYCFNAGEWSFPDGPAYGIYYRRGVYAHVTGWEAFEPVLSRAEKISLSQLWEMAKDIPEEWYQQDAAGLARLIERLYRRRTILREQILKLREAHIEPFPRWQSN